ncbi:hypothetical protein PHLGIDRAFT_150238 [Phlebiopsis gigantea 11061_1 CR5-6]|uniref:Uncharacterized protein n=1 Tax=Phlebiopsis gigantea (strain 11061_1 CR5-6) TaxID=745531 RepID=A0A0C3RVT5_PHLG1|nr:hypothetical protein PHLGIDRAFT_150238 [Phlebiopsis gigantea 11061_1 CR5-6]
MALVDLLSVSPRELFEALLAVLFGTILSQQVFRPSLLSAPRARPTYAALPPGPVPTPVLLLLDPPPLASGFPTSISIRHNQTSLLQVSPLAYEHDEFNISPQKQNLDVIVYFAVALILYLIALIITTSHRTQRRSDVPATIAAQLYQSLTGRPYSPTHWERVLSGPDTGLNWYINSPDLLFGLDASVVPDSLPPASDTPSENSSEESPKYAGYFDAERIDAFAAFLFTLGYTDLRIWAFDVTPGSQPSTSSAVTVDFRFTARSATQELMTRSILRFVPPRDVPEERKDFLLWDLGQGWVRAFEVGSFEAETLPVSQEEEQHAREGDNLAHLVVLPFFSGEDETAGAVKIDQWAVAITSPPTSTRHTPTANLEPLFVEMLFNQSSSSAKSFRRRTATAFTFDTSRNQRALVPANCAFAEEPRGRPTMRKLLAASVAPVEHETSPRMTEAPVLVADGEAMTDLDDSWSEHMADSQTLADSVSTSPPEDDDFVVVAGGDLAGTGHASGGKEAASSPVLTEGGPVSGGEAREEQPAVVEATEASPGLGESVEAADPEPSRAAATADPEAPAWDALPDRDVAPQASTATAPDVLERPAPAGGAPAVSEDAGSPPAVPPTEGLVFEDASTAQGVAHESLEELALRESAVPTTDEPLAHLPAPDARVPEPSLSLHASIGALVDAALNSVIELPAPELLSESIVDVQRELAVLEHAEPTMLKAPSQYLRVHAGNQLVDNVSSVEDLDVEEPQSALIGPVMPPSGV